MKLTKLIAITALTLGIAQFHASAQGNTALNVTITANLIIQSTNSFTNAHTQTVTVSAPQRRTLTTADLLKRLAVDAHLQGNLDATNFPRGSRLVITNGAFVVVSGTNIVADVSNFITIDSQTNFIFSGSTTTNNLAGPTQTVYFLGRLVFDDTSVNTTNGLRFYLQGVLTAITTDSVPNRNTGVFTQSVTASMPQSAGEGNLGVGSNDEREILATGSVFASGSGKSTLD